MDRETFDAFTRAFAEGTSRRGLLRWLAAGAGAGLVGRFGRQAAAQDVVGGEAGTGVGALGDNGGGVAIADASGGHHNVGAICGPCPECRVCDPAAGGCAPDPSKDGRSCDPGDACTRDGTCRNGRCEGKKRRNGDRCGDDQVCCDGQCCAAGRECRGGRCAEVSSEATCLATGADCSSTSECCSGRCEGVCCQPGGEACAVDEDCCPGTFCNISTGQCVVPQPT